MKLFMIFSTVFLGICVMWAAAAFASPYNYHFLNKVNNNIIVVTPGKNTVSLPTVGGGNRVIVMPREKP